MMRSSDAPAGKCLAIQGSFGDYAIFSYCTAAFSGSVWARGGTFVIIGLAAFGDHRQRVWTGCFQRRGLVSGPCSAHRFLLGCSPEAHIIPFGGVSKPGFSAQYAGRFVQALRPWS